MTTILTSNRLPFLHRNARSRYITAQEIHQVYWQETRRGIHPTAYEPYTPDADLECATWRYQA